MPLTLIHVHFSPALPPSLPPSLSLSLSLSLIRSLSRCSIMTSRVSLFGGTLGSALARAPDPFAPSLSPCSKNAPPQSSQKASPHLPSPSSSSRVPFPVFPPPPHTPHTPAGPGRGASTWQRSALDPGTGMRRFGQILAEANEQNTIRLKRFTHRNQPQGTQKRNSTCVSNILPFEGELSSAICGLKKSSKCSCESIATHQQREVSLSHWRIQVLLRRRKRNPKHWGIFVETCGTLQNPLEPAQLCPPFDGSVQLVH